MGKLVKNWKTASGLEAWIWLVRDSHHCGYVEIPEKLKEEDFYNFADDSDTLEVHGGVTYQGAPDWSDGVQVVGYDCAHAGDACFGYADEDDVWRDEEFCVEQCESLAKQLTELESK